MLFDDAAGLLDAAVRAASTADDPRLVEIVTALIRAGHSFIQTTRLTEAEFHRGLAFITAIGQQTTAQHNEVILAADVFGLSTLVTLINNDGALGETASALLGPFYRHNSPARQSGESIVRSPTPGETLLVRGSIHDVEGAPIANALVDIWQASPSGFYENQDASQADMNLRGAFRTDAQGRFCCRTVIPAGYPVPTDGAVGDLLRRQKRSPYRPAHIHFVIVAEGYATLITQIFLADEAQLVGDVVFGARRSLVGRMTPVTTRLDDAPDIEPPYMVLEQDFILKAGTSFVPDAPIA